MTDVLFVNTSNTQTRKIFHEANSLPPLGILYMAACLKQELGAACHVVDLTVHNLTEGQFSALLQEHQPRIVGLAMYADSYRQVLVLAHFIKTVLPNCHVTIGGAGATFLYDQALRECPSIDSVVIGEGERTMTALTNAVCQNGRGRGWQAVDGIAYRSEGETVRTEPRARIRNLDDLPYPDRSLVRNEIEDCYTIAHTISTCRGCPGNCIFCSSRAFWGSKVRFRSAAHIYSEIAYLCDEYQACSFHITDDTFTSNRQLVMDVCRMMKEDRMKAEWSCESRADVATRPLLQAMFDAGCRSIQFGIESSKQEILNALGKKVTVEQIENAVQLADEIGYRVVGSFILGHYLDTRETMVDTIEFCRRLRDKYRFRAAFSLNTPFPGTYQRDQAKKLGMTIHTADPTNLVLFTPHVSTDHFTTNHLRELYSYAYDLLGS